MTEDVLDQEVEGQAAPSHVVDSEDFFKAGLRDEGVYHWRIKKMYKQTKDGKNGPYDVITGILEPFEEAIFDEDGSLDEIVELEEFQRGEFQDFALSGKGLGRLKSLYKAHTGNLPQGTLNPATGRYEIDLLAVAEECIGAEVWTSYTHTKPDEETKAVYGRLGFTYTTQPKAVKRLLPQKEDESEDGSASDDE